MGINMLVKTFLHKKNIRKYNSYLSVSTTPISIYGQRLRGIVTSISMEKTVVVTSNRLLKDPLYGKLSKVTKKYLAHVEEGNCELGDEVILKPSKPISKKKR